MHRREKNTCLIVVRKSVVADTASTTFFKEHTAWTAGASPFDLLSQSNLPEEPSVPLVSQMDNSFRESHTANPTMQL